MTIIVTNGRDEIRAPSLSLRFAVSEINTIKNAVIKYLEIKKLKIKFPELKNIDLPIIQ